MEAARTATATAVERRIVSVLFADLVGFTPLSERLDAEDVATIQNAYFDVVRETIGRYGGQLEKFIGDAAMAVFGVPRSRDDDAERAVRAGLALTSAVAQLGARLGLEEDELRLRVGVNTGEVVHAVGGPDAGRVTGDTVNTAARLQAAAPAGTVLLGEDAALAVAEAIEVGAVRSLELKGKAAPVRAFDATAVRPHRSREIAMGSLRAPTIGREEELERLSGRIGEVVAASSPSSERWLLIAPPGVGKTRLVDELVRRVEALAQPPTVRRVRLRPETTGAYDPLLPLATAVLGASGLAPTSAAFDPLAERLVDRGVGEARARIVALELL
ncbi:MAG TPA: adenylate/guanylate cyclase domain-containing protein, partial [Candidatus Limnocylindrales bacterium]